MQKVCKYLYLLCWRLQFTWSSESITTHRYLLPINQQALDMMHDCGFAQTVNFFTRNDNVLNLIFMYRPTFVQQCYSAQGISDHEVVMVTLEPQAI